MATNPANRIRIISLGVIALALILVAKLYLVQIVHGNVFASRAEHQYVTPNDDSFRRGAIYFKDKNDRLISAATLATGFTIAIDPSKIKDAQKVYEQINAITPIDKELFDKSLLKTNDPYEEIAKRVEKDKADKIQSLKIASVGVYPESWRFYPGNTLAAHVLGFVGSDGKTIAGRYGLEKQYNSILSRNDSGMYVNFFAEVFSTIKKATNNIKNPPLEGDVVLTIEPTVQNYLEERLAATKKEWSADLVGGIVIDPVTGKIFAMGANPTFDPNDFEKEKDLQVFTNPLVNQVYEMGSIIKPLTMSAGIDVGAVTPETTYNDQGFILVDKAKISNYDGKGRGVINMQGVLNNSLNTGVSFVVSKMGTAKFAEYMRNYGIGEKTGIDLPNEASGIIDNLSSPRKVEYYTASFGQGIAMTPIETVRALSSLANGGKLITPHVTEKVQYDLGFEKTPEYPAPKQVLKPETSATITNMLVNVVDQALAGGKIKMEHYSMAAKTGTAQMSNPVTHKYYDDRFLHSFFGYFPAHNPRFLVFMFMVYPKNVKYASETLTQPFDDMAKYLINYYNLPPDR